jgi:hypothetical protein
MMNSMHTSDTSDAARRKESLLLWGVVALALAVGGYVIFKLSLSPERADARRSAEVDTVVSAADSARASEQDLMWAAPTGDRGSRYAAARGSEPDPSVGASSAGISRAERQAEADSVLLDLRQLGQDAVTIDAAQAREIRRYFDRLAALGRAGVPAIADFLATGEDVSFARLRGGDLVGHASLRAGLIDVLGRVGGAEAVEVLATTLGTTSDPEEVAALARALEWTAPGRYRAELLGAARESLKVASEAIADQSRTPATRGSAIDVSPLFDVIRALGTTALLSDLVQEANETMPPWKVYSMIALSQMQNGEGVSALRDALVTPDGALSESNLFALQMLGQAAAVDPRAGEALMEVALDQGDRIPVRDWKKLAWTLRGHSYDFGGDLGSIDGARASAAQPGSISMDAHMHSLSLHLKRSASDPATWPAGRAERQVTLIDQLLAAGPPAEAAYDLERTRDFILRRSGAAGF